mmetsp:Transcript_26765/g.64913  ORF Transcript_26765/g.64913 Transcript_26765/m.64913 type:complete len:316 (-) Transcript_26765:377-1324(-)
MQLLMVKNLYLFPRFHVQVDADLGAAPPEVVEIYPPLTDSMRRIQEAIGEVMTACLTELKTKNRAALADITVEDCLYKAVDARVRNTLMPTWDRIDPHSKTLVRDLGTLSELLSHLLALDCIAFYTHLRRLRAQKAKERSFSGFQASLWMLTKSADLLFRAARERVYLVEDDMSPLPTLVRRTRSGRGKGGGGGGARVRPVLEVNPKWELLREVLAEIEEEVEEEVKRKRKTKRRRRTRESPVASFPRTLKRRASSRSFLRSYRSIPPPERPLPAFSAPAGSAAQTTRSLLRPYGRRMRRRRDGKAKRRARRRRR